MVKDELSARRHLKNPRTKLIVGVCSSVIQPTRRREKNANEKNDEKKLERQMRFSELLLSSFFVAYIVTISGFYPRVTKQLQ